MGDRRISAARVQASLHSFLDLLESGMPTKDSISNLFDVFEASPEEGEGLVTGYYEPVLEGCSPLDRSQCYPLYGVPPDLVTVDLASFPEMTFPVAKLTGRLVGNRVIPYYSRAEIDGENTLNWANCEIAWVRDPVEAFFLHVQGSGVVSLPDGSEFRVGFAASNGRAYRSVGRVLIERGLLSSEQATLQTIKEYLRNHPEDRNALMWQNESYIFFRKVADGPLGSLEEPLTPGRSIATDHKYHPKGALAFLETSMPEIDQNGHLVGWKPVSRWVLNQDTGAAIKGVGRVDLFCGTGKKAEDVAGRMKQPGRLYFLMLKER